MQKCYNLMDRRVEKVKNKRQGGVGEGKKNSEQSLPTAVNLANDQV